jgi:putative transposase
VAAQHLVEAGRCSQRQACRFLNLSRSGVRYQEVTREGEVALVEQLQTFAKKRCRRSYRLAHQELRRGGMVINHKRVHRLWRREGLSVPPRRKHKRIRGTAPPRLCQAERPNHVWCLDFVEESNLSGKKLRVLCVSDEFTRQSLAIEVAQSFRSEQVCEVLQEIMHKRGVPEALRMDPP